MIQAMILPFLINFGVNKAMGMSTGKALGLAGVQAFTGPAGQAGGGGIGGIVGAENFAIDKLGSEAVQKSLFLEGGKTLLSAQADKRYGINPMLTYGGLTGLEGGIGGLGEGGKGFTEGVKGAFNNPFKGDPSKLPGAGVPVDPNATKKASEGILGYGTGVDIGAGVLASQLFLGGKGGDKPERKEEGFNLNYPNVKDLVTNFNIIDPVTGTKSKLAIGESPEERFLKTGYKSRFKDGGLAKFNNGALVSMLPGKSLSDEKDPSVYKRAYNFVADETGNGDMEEDTMLAQLADGEFVTTAKAVLGAGIFQGAGPGNMKAMRDKGAKFFYDQQAKFKRVYEMLEDAKGKEVAA
jgi:hypothetical protein